MEEWKCCFENYEISNLGNCRRKLISGDYKIIGGSILNRGYRYFQINRNGKRTNYLFHHLVAEQFIGERPEGLVIDHIDRDKLNNNISNLRYVSQNINMRNTDKYLEHIQETDPKKRAIIRTKEYAEKNREKVLQNKKIYYQNNKDKLLEYNKNNKVDVICNECNTSRTITKKTYNRGIRLGVNICKRCSSIKNLPK